MAWLKDHGLVGCFADYADLPAYVLDDARLLMEAEDVQAQREAAARTRG